MVCEKGLKHHNVIIFMGLTFGSKFYVL